MEKKAVKSELIGHGKRQMSVLEGEIMSGKCIKRRRRDSCGVGIGCKEQQVEQQKQQLPNQSVTTATTVKRSSRFRGVSRHRWTGRYEAHLWDKGSWNPTQRKKGKQVYLGAYDEEESAARAYDLAALKYWGTSTFTNFPESDYEKEVEIMKNVTKEEYLASLRRRSSGFSRGVSKYRGVARHHHNGRWEARIGRVFGNKYLYLGTYSTQEEAAHAYDIAAIEYRGINAVTNFDLSTYIRWLRPGANSYASQEPKSIITSSNNLIPNKETTQMPIFNPNSFTINDLDTSNQQEVFHSQIPISPCSNTSSPSALGILLKSSVFRDLVEKNLSTENELNEANHPKTNNFDMISYDGIGNLSYSDPSKCYELPGLVSQEDNTLPLFNGRGQALWNFPLNSSSPSLHFN
ncbi:hypothetical protein UlMin_041328 [Ulmus minor]